MLNDRNELAHDYDGSLARECVDIIIAEYIPVFESFRQKAEHFIDQMKAE